jgi:hypothetical protein
MIHDKAPGQLKLTTDMIKSLPLKATEFYIESIQEFWRNKEVDLESWHTTALNTIYKGKGDPQDPNNHHRIALKETSAKALSIIISRRLLKKFTNQPHLSIWSYRMSRSPTYHQDTSGTNTD